MRRPANTESTAERIHKWRAEVPDLVLRSSFIVGFPGETEADFDMLLDWLKEARIDRAGCFKYENVTGAARRALEGHVPEEVKEERWHRFMALQAELSDERSKAEIGKTIDVLIDEVDEDGAVGRSQAGCARDRRRGLPPDATGLKPGDLIRATVTAGDQSDLWAELAPKASHARPFAHPAAPLAPH